jgi:hypothetical protein
MVEAEDFIVCLCLPKLILVVALIFTSLPCPEVLNAHYCNMLLLQYNFWILIASIDPLEITFCFFVCHFRFRACALNAVLDILTESQHHILMLLNPILIVASATSWKRFPLFFFYMFMFQLCLYICGNRMPRFWLSHN